MVMEKEKKEKGINCISGNLDCKVKSQLDGTQGLLAVIQDSILNKDLGSVFAAMAEKRR